MRREEKAHKIYCDVNMLAQLFIALAILSESVQCYIMSKSSASLARQQRPFALEAVPDWLKEDATNDDIEDKTLTVRFINTPTGKDVVVDGVIEGTNLLFIGDSAGVKLPRACRTGLCGACTTEVQDPLAIATSTNPRAGFATLRACSTKCYVPNGLTEMVVDVHRLKPTKKKIGGSTSSQVEEYEETMANPMARFSGDWERDFKPNWELAKDRVEGVEAVRLSPGMTACKKCSGNGRIMCYNCLGLGKVMMSDRSCQCSTCVGMQTVGCGYCNASGMLLKKKA